MFYFVLNSLIHYFASIFSVSMSWVDRFKLRHNIVSRAISGKYGVVDLDVTFQ